MSTRIERKGFSLIELLVVIAIVAVMVATILPAISQAKDSAVIAVCASTEHQLTVGIAAYAQDNKNSLPPHNVSIAVHTGFADWGGGPTSVVMGANNERAAQAGAPYGNYMGLGHVAAGGYFNDPNTIKQLMEPTMRYPWNAGLSAPGLFQSSYNFLWRNYRLVPNTSAPSVVWSYIGYYYRGWINTVQADAGLPPKLDSMGTRAAVWDHMVDWGSQIRVTLTHPNGYNVGHYDGHVSSFRDQNAALTFTYVYWSEAPQLYTVFDKQ